MAAASADLGLTRQLSKFYSGLEYENLSPQVIDRAKYLCLDYLSMAVRGSETPSSVTMRQVVKSLSGNGDSVIMGTSVKASPEYAALANGTAAHSIELDDVSNDASLHPAVATFPTAFACADMERVDGRQFMTAITAGYDLMVRLGRALDPRKHYARGFHPTATCGTFGAAVVTSSLLDLDERRTTWALGIAGSQAAGSQEYLAQGAWTKRMHPGWAAHSGLIAGLLAREGFLGPTTIFEGQNGFLHGYTDDADPSKVLEGLGEMFYINKISIKAHSCCRYNQGPIDCILKIMNDNGLKPDDVKAVTVAILKGGFNTVAAPEEQKRSPQNVVEAQFSMPYGAAVAILYGRASLSEYTEDVVAHPDTKEMMSRVRCVEDPAIEVNYPSRWPAWAEIETQDGRKLRVDTQYPKGDPENALSWDEMKDKFRDLTGTLLSPGRQNEIIGAVESLENLEDIRVLAQLTSV